MCCDSIAVFSCVQVFNMNEFKEELSQLLRRYASSAEATDNNKTLKNDRLLSNQQILDAIHETLHIALNIHLQNVESSELKTPMNEIVVTTPNAPDVLRMDYIQDNLLQNRYKSSESKAEEKSCNEYNFMSTENGTLPTVKLGLNKNFKNIAQKLKDTANFDADKNAMMYKMVEDAHKDTMKVVHKLEDLRELLLPETRAVRRLSVRMNLPKSQEQKASTNSSHLRTKSRAAAMTRRSSLHQLNEVTPGTPTSSRPSSLAVPPRTALHEETVTEADTLAQSRSASTLTLATKSNKSAGIGGTGSASKPAAKAAPVKNSKYAHVKSTIPKPTSMAVKRRLQQEAATSR